MKLHFSQILHETPLIDALDMLMNEKISGVPVVRDEDGLEVSFASEHNLLITVIFS